MSLVARRVLAAAACVTMGVAAPQVVQADPSYASLAPCPADGSRQFAEAQFSWVIGLDLIGEPVIDTLFLCRNVLERPIDTRVPAGRAIRVEIPEAAGGRLVFGQLTVDETDGPGYLTSFPCAEGPPRYPMFVGAIGRVVRSDLNYDGRVNPVASNRLVVAADSDGAICVYTSNRAHIIVDVDAVATLDQALEPTSNRIDTRPFRISGGRCFDELSPGGQGAMPCPPGVPKRTTGGVYRFRIGDVSTPRIGQLTVDLTSEPGFATVFPCADGLPHGTDGTIAHSDLNFNGRLTPVASNRLLATTDANSDICVYVSADAALIVDDQLRAPATFRSVNVARVDTRRGADGPHDGCGHDLTAGHWTDTGITPCTATGPTLDAGDTMRVHVDAAAGGQFVVGQLTVDLASDAGYLTAYPCADGLPRKPDRTIAKSDLNVNGHINPFASNRLITQADANGDVCIHTTTAAAVIVDITHTATGITSIPHRRTDTRLGWPITDGYLRPLI